MDPIVGGLIVGSLRKWGIPILKEIGKGIAKVGMKRVATVTTAVTGSWDKIIADGVITDEEMSQFARVGRAALGDATVKITKEEANRLTKTVLMNGMGLSDAEAEMMIMSVVKAKKQGINPETEIGIKPEDEDSDDTKEIG